MPTPNKGETEQHFVSRCISYLFHREGFKDKKKAAGRCYGIYRSWKRKQ